MLVQTHLHLATVVYNHIKSKYKVELRHDMLQYGSIKPDLLWEYSNVPHSYEEGFPFFVQELKKLAESEQIPNIKEFSIKLGVILHFAADYFCFAHNDKVLKENMWQHFLYELKLHSHFVTYTGNGKDQYLPLFQNPVNLICHLRKKYLEKKAGVENDCYFIHTACLQISAMLTEKIVLPFLKAA